MKRLSIWLLPLVLILAFFSCETPEDIDGEGKSKTEQSSGNKGGKDNTNGSTTANDSASNDSSSTSPFDQGVDTDTGDPDYGTDHEETDFTDGNDKTHGGISTGDTLTCTQFINADNVPEVFVVGYIIGTCTKSFDKYADFVPPFGDVPGLLIADSKDERNKNKIVIVQLLSRYRTDFNLQDHPDYFGKRIIVYGSKTTYLKITGIKNPGMVRLYE